MSSQQNVKYCSFALVLLLLVILAACQPSNSASTVTPEPTLTIQPSQVPTRQPLGSEERPIFFGIVTTNASPEFSLAADDLAFRLSDGFPYKVQVKPFPSSVILLKQMEIGEVHIAFLQPLTYLLANKNGYANAVLLANHFGVYQYGIQFLANVNTGFFPAFDTSLQSQILDIQSLLMQFQGKRPCWTTPHSISGYVYPAGLLRLNNVNLQDGVFTLSHTALVRALYITGICDFGVSYAISGDARTAETVQGDLSDVLNRVVVIWRSEPVIPNMNISFHPEIPDNIRQSLMTSFLVLGQIPEGRQLLSNLADYQIQEFMIIDDSFYDGFREIVQYRDVDLRDSIGN